MAQDETRPMSDDGEGWELQEKGPVATAIDDMKRRRAELEFMLWARKGEIIAELREVPARRKELMAELRDLDDRSKELITDEQIQELSLRGATSLHELSDRRAAKVYLERLRERDGCGNNQQPPR